MAIQRPPKIIVNCQDGTVATVGNVAVGEATVRHNGISLCIGAERVHEETDGVIHAQAGASVHDIVAGLHAAGAEPQEVVAIFSMLRQAGALLAEVELH